MRFVARFGMKQITRKLNIIVKSVLFKDQHWILWDRPTDQHAWLLFFGETLNQNTVQALFLYLDL